MAFRKINPFTPFQASSSREENATNLTTGSFQYRDRSLEIRCVAWDDIVNRATASLAPGWTTTHRTNQPSPNNDYATYINVFDERQSPTPNYAFTEGAGAIDVVTVTAVYSCGPGNYPITATDRFAQIDGSGYDAGDLRMDYRSFKGEIHGDAVLDSERLIVTRSIESVLVAQAETQGDLRMDYRSFAGTIDGSSEFTTQRLGITRLIESTVAGIAQTEGFGTRVRYFDGQINGIAMASKGIITGVRNLGVFTRYVNGQAQVSGQGRLDLKMVPAEIQALARASGKVQLYIILPDSEVHGDAQLLGRPLRKTVDLVSPGQVILVDCEAEVNGDLRMDYRSFSGVIGATSEFEKTDFFFIYRPASEISGSIVGKSSVTGAPFGFVPFFMEGGPIEPIVIYLAPDCTYKCYLTEAQEITLGIKE